jgi:hypothetical protein
MVSMVAATLQGQARCDRFSEHLLGSCCLKPYPLLSPNCENRLTCSLARSVVRRPSRRASVAVRAEQPLQPTFAVSRREAGLAALAAVAALANVAPASAGLFGGGQKAEEEYQQKTVSSKRLAAERSGCRGSAINCVASLTGSPSSYRMVQCKPGVDAGALQASIIKNILDAVALDRDAPNREDLLNTVRLDSNAWVAKYRR